MIQRHRSTGIHLQRTITGFQGRDFDNATLIPPGLQGLSINRPFERAQQLEPYMEALNFTAQREAEGLRQEQILDTSTEIKSWCLVSQLGENKRPALKWMCRALTVSLKRLSHTSRSPTVTDDIFGCPSSPIVTKMTNCRVEAR